MSADSVTPFGFESLPVRGALIHLSRSWRRMLRDHDYNALVTETLGHAAAATGLIAQSLKFDGAITLQIQGAGVLQMLVMQCTSEYDVRGMAAVHEGSHASDFSELTANAHCAVTVDAGERPYQGIVAIDDASLAASLEHYFDRSVQVPSHMALVANEKVAGGVLLQQVPGETIDTDDWNRLHLLAATLAHKDFDGEAGLELIGKLFAEDDVRVYEPRPVNFRCRCSARKTEDVLKMLGEGESRAALEEQGRIEVICEYCGRRRHFDAVDVERIFADNVVPAPDSVQ
ncbi:MAG: Hsp33 family molecular chaperone HslO [Woeseiaceae bacterium]|nr:Hsp33 family molecular chaperone HslO [Woeseiaceae bacterium]